MNSETGTGMSIPHPMGDELKKSLGSDLNMLPWLHLMISIWHTMVKKNLMKSGQGFASGKTRGDVIVPCAMCR